MPRAGSVCSRPGCPKPATQRGKCDDCAREADKARGTRQQRGYGAAHVAERKRWAPRVARGMVRCWRCHEEIQPGEAWDLGHDDYDRDITRGPEHANRCNRSAAGKAAHRGSVRPPD